MNFAALAALSFLAQYPVLPPGGDVDNDGIPNQVEYALLGQSVMQPEPMRWPALQWQSFSVVASFQTTECSGIRFIVQLGNDDLTSWQDQWHAPISEGKAAFRLRAETNASFAAWSDALDMLLPASSLNLFSVRDDTAALYARSATCWAASLDTSAVSVWNSQAGNQMAGTAITAHNVLFATHWRPAVGTVCRWVSMAGEVIEREIAAMHDLPSTGWMLPDLSVATLNAPLPASILPASRMTAADLASLPTWQDFRVPALWINRNKQAAVFDIYAVIARTLVSGSYYGQRLTASQPAVSGDSGCPVFIATPDGLKLLGLMTTPLMASSVAASENQINALLTPPCPP